MPKILIADDNMDGLFCVKTLLNVMGNEVMAAYNGLAAVTMTADLDPDIVLLDYKMPNIDGKLAATHIREADKDRHRLLIEVTGLPDTEFDVFDFRMQKPLNFHELYTKCLERNYDINPAQVDLEILK